MGHKKCNSSARYTDDFQTTWSGGRVTFASDKRERAARDRETLHDDAANMRAIAAERYKGDGVDVHQAARAHREQLHEREAREARRQGNVYMPAKKAKCGCPHKRSMAH